MITKENSFFTKASHIRIVIVTVCQKEHLFPMCTHSIHRKMTKISTTTALKLQYLFNRSGNRGYKQTQTPNIQMSKLVGSSKWWTYIFDDIFFEVFQCFLLYRTLYSSQGISDLKPVIYRSTMTWIMVVTSSEGEVSTLKFQHLFQ